jgi:hypothetical protein
MLLNLTFTISAELGFRWLDHGVVLDWSPVESGLAAIPHHGQQRTGIHA